MRVHWTGPCGTPVALDDWSVRPARAGRVSHPRPIPVPSAIARFNLVVRGQIHGAETDHDRQVPAPLRLNAITTHVISNEDIRGGLSGHRPFYPASSGAAVIGKGRVDANRE